MSALVMVRPVQAETIPIPAFFCMNGVCNFSSWNWGTSYNSLGDKFCSSLYSSTRLSNCSDSLASCMQTCVGGGGQLAYKTFNYCPPNQNWTKSGSNCVRPDCVSGQVRNISTGICEAAPVVCPPAGTSAGSYYVHTGDFPNSIYLGLSGVQYCVDGCKVSSVIEIVGSGAGGTPYPALWKLVNGVKQYYAYRSYSHDGETCTAGSGLDAQPAAATVPATDTCAPGQSIIQMGAQVRCLNPSTGEISSTNSASAVAAAETLAAQKRAAEIAAAQVAAGAAGLGASGVETAGAVAAGVGAAGGVGGVVVSGSTGDPVMDAFCDENPGADICKQGRLQAKEGGELPDIGDESWYEKTYPDGIDGVLTENFDTMKNSPLLGLLNNIVPTLSGAAHNGCFSIEVWNVGMQSLCIPPFVLDALGLFMILTALFAARSIIFGG